MSESSGAHFPASPDFPDFPEFCARLDRESEAAIAGRAASDRLGDDLELDSLQRLELLVAVEELGVYLPDDCVGPEQTLGGLYDAYRAALTSSPPGSPPAPGAAGRPGP